MFSLRKLLIWFAALAAFMSLSAVVLAVDFSSRDLERLAAGKTVKKPLEKSCTGGFYGGTGWALIDAPADVIWKAISDWDSYPQFFPRTVATEQIVRNDSNSTIRMTIGYNLVNFEYRLNVVSDKAKNMVSFALSPHRSNDIKDTRGYWRLFPQEDGRTLVAYGVALQMPSDLISLLGAKMEKKFERNLIGLPGYLKKWVEGPAGDRYRHLTAMK